MTTNQFRKREYEWNDEEDDQPPKNRPFQPWEIDYYNDLAAKKQKDESQEHVNTAVSVVSPYEKCSCYNMAGHEVDECRYRIAMENAEAEIEPTPPPKCKMCNGEHVTQSCHILAPYKEPIGVECEKGYKYKYMEPKVAPTISQKQCRICYEEHKGICRYAEAVEKGALISPFFPIFCRECNEVLDNSFWCTRCNKEMIGYVTVCDLCEVCGKMDMSPNCCPYGRLVFDNFRRSHPSGNGKLWPLLEDDI